MPTSRISAVALAAAVCAGQIANAAAQDSTAQMPDVAAMSVDEIIALRVDTMRSNGRTLRGASLLSGDHAIAAAAQIVHNAQLLKLLFPEGSNTGGSHALAKIWTDWDKFIAILDKLETDAGTALAAAQAGDQDGFITALRMAGSNCNACHMTYRAPL